MATALADLAALVRIPSVAWPSFDPSQVQASAEAVAALAERSGVFDTVVIRRAAAGDGEPGQPAVLATRAARDGAPTILLYAHHDVQPPGDDAQWESPPFQPTVRGGRLYGRGAADDKAGVMVHLAALRAVHEVLGADLGWGVTLFVEGEEEYGSRSFAALLAEHHDALRSDVIVVADSGNWDERTPALTVSLRGMVRFILSVRTLEHASHSGMYGGAVPDAMLALIRLLDSLWSEDGSVAVSGLTSYPGPVLAYGEDELRAETGLLPSVVPIGDGPLLGRIWHGPAVTVTGLDAPSVTAASNTLAPRAAAVVSVRIAPDQPATEAFEAIAAHLREHAPFGADIEIAQVDCGDGFVVDTRAEAVTAALAGMREGYGVEPVLTGVGGSIPFVADLVRAFPAAQILITGVEDPGSRAHSPNESLHLDTFRKAVLAEALLLEALQRNGPRRGPAA